MAELNTPKRILVIRRDNIGDLLCTTPTVSALRQHYPKAQLDMLVNSYNAPVLRGNPDIDQVFAYTKAKHSDKPKLLAVLDEARLFWTLRRRHYDLILHANPTPHKRTAKLVRFLKPTASIGVVKADDPEPVYTQGLLESDLSGPHHVQRVFSLLKPLGIDAEPGKETLISQAKPHGGIGIHLSSRKPCNRWPVEHYIKLIHQLAKQAEQTYLFWAPGSQNNKQHPGDDELAQQVKDAVGDAVTLVPTHTLHELIDAMAACRKIISPDGGALHIAAALGKPMVALFGCTDATQWGPWGTHNTLLHGKGNAANIQVAAVLQALKQHSPS